MLNERVGYEIHLKERPLGIASENNFELVRVRVPDLKQGQILVRNIWMSVDPYMRGRMSETKSYQPPFELNKPLEGDCIGQIIESKNRQFEVGEYLLSNFGWREYWVSTGSNDISKIVPSIAPLQSYLGIMGRTGLTAYVGLLIGELTDSSTSNTVFVSAASGAVGSAACQIAKIKIPTLIVHGTNDNVCLFELASSMHDGIKGSQLVPIEKAGHGFYYEEKEKLNNELVNFMA